MVSVQIGSANATCKGTQRSRLCCHIRDANGTARPAKIAPIPETDPCHPCEGRCGRDLQVACRDAHGLATLCRPMLPKGMRSITLSHLDEYPRSTCRNPRRLVVSCSFLLGCRACSARNVLRSIGTSASIQLGPNAKAPGSGLPSGRAKVLLARCLGGATLFGKHFLPLGSWAARSSTAHFDR